MENWMKKSKYYVPWEEYEKKHPQIDEKNKAAMRDRYEAYQNKMFDFVMTLLF